MRDELLHIIGRSPLFRQALDLCTALEPGSYVRVRGAAGSLTACLAVAAAGRSSCVVLLARDEDRAEKLRDDAAFLTGEERVKYLGFRPMHAGQLLDLRGPIAQTETLRALAGGENVLIVAPPASAVQMLPAPDALRASMIEMRAGHDYPFTGFVERLDQLGFIRKEFVESYGDYALRGGIVDVFPFVGEHPVRLEFWGDSLESVREFDVLSQRSIRHLPTAVIAPSFEPPDGGASAGDQQAFTHTLFDYLPADAILLLDEPAFIRNEIRELTEEGIPDILTFAGLADRMKNFRILVQAFADDLAGDGLREAGEINFSATPQPPFNGSSRQLVRFLDGLAAAGYTSLLASDTSQETERLRVLVDDVLTEPVHPGSADAVPSSHLAESPPLFFTGALHEGFIWDAEKLAVITEHEIFGRQKRRGLEKKKRFKGFSQKELQQLKPGDYVVHVDHGIGIYGGLVTLNVGGVEQEAMKILFLENDAVYVNLNYLDRVQKFSAQEGHVPKLQRLGSGEWEKITSRARRKLKDIARDIIALYAKRKLEEGRAFSPDSHWQRELEASFMYEDTPDQASATAAVKQDMEQPVPMDRLICGDVGFGKTEVAVRAVFKAVADGTQAAVLVPTTILALQHYNTFRDRLSRYTVRVEHLTRFRTPASQREVVQRLKEGAVDVIIGTHRLLSKDIGFRNLGLLVVDEEHRFGVAAKEKLRELKASVDTLSLTATPIPRTLHFSLIGARDLSLITTPPRNRLPIITEIIPGDSSGRQIHWEVVREAVLRELHRGGQIYFVHDRIETIDEIAGRVRTLVPNLRVHVAHGQMAGHELEKTMLAFLEKKYDVLVATKIIESGLDIPNVNTIIINRADRFGLAELYQLRGRVGRSNQQAYAYLLVPPFSVLPRLSLRRLQAIEEFTELGSGFNLAMRDLEIRGAGNLLGAEQSGFIMEMGFEMYERILSEAVAELKEQEFSNLFRDGTVPAHRRADTVVETDIEAIIPEIYCDSDTERLDIYRRLSRTRTAEELTAMREELRDRFGEYPEEVGNLFRVVDLRIAAGAAGIPRLALRGDSCILTLPAETDETFYGTGGDENTPFQRLMSLAVRSKDPPMKLKQEGQTLQLVCRIPAQGTGERFDAAAKLLKTIQSAVIVPDSL